MTGYYLRKRGRWRGAPLYVVQHPDPSRGTVRSKKLFLDARSGSNHRHRELQTDTISAASRRLLVKHNVFEEQWAFKAEHIRHTTLSYVYHRRPADFDIALSRSRHKRSTFTSQYERPLSERARVILTALPDDCPIEWVFLG